MPTASYFLLQHAHAFGGFDIIAGGSTGLADFTLRPHHFPAMWHQTILDRRRCSMRPFEPTFTISQFPTPQRHA